MYIYLVVCLSVSVFFCIGKISPFSAVIHKISMIVRICLTWVKREMYAFEITLRPLGTMRWSEDSSCLLQYYLEGSQDIDTKIHFSISSHYKGRSQRVVCIKTPGMYLLQAASVDINKTLKMFHEGCAGLERLKKIYWTGKAHLKFEKLKLENKRQRKQQQNLIFRMLALQAQP